MLGCITIPALTSTRVGVGCYHVSVAGLAGFERKLVQGGGHVIESIFFMGDFGWRLRGVRGLGAVWRQGRHGLT